VNIDTWYVLLIVLCQLNLYVSIFISRRDDLIKFQKIAQIIIVWLIPIIAAVGLWLFHRNSDLESSPKKNTNFAKDDQAYSSNNQHGEL
jgi:hypothetical protein